MNTARKRRQERRIVRHSINKEKDLIHKEEAWKNGQLIRPSSNSYFWDESYLIEFGQRLSDIMKDLIGQPNEFILNKFRLYKEAIRDFILKFDPKVKKSENYFYLKTLLETYWDEPENLYSKL